MAVPVIVDATALQVAEEFASKLFASTYVMPTQAEAISLLHESADFPEDEASLYVARYLWPNLDDMPACSRSALPQAVRNAFRDADRVAQRLGEEAEARALEQEARAKATTERLAAEDDRLAAARELAAAAA